MVTKISYQDVLKYWPYALIALFAGLDPMEGLGTFTTGEGGRLFRELPEPQEGVYLWVEDETHPSSGEWKEHDLDSYTREVYGG